MPDPVKCLEMMKYSMNRIQSVREADRIKCYITLCLLFTSFHTNTLTTYYDINEVHAALMVNHFNKS